MSKAYDWIWASHEIFYVKFVDGRSFRLSLRGWTMLAIGGLLLWWVFH